MGSASKDYQSLDSVSDVTALWNTNAFFAYIFTVKLLQLKWEPRRLVAVLLATLGVVVVVYGGSTASKTEGPRPQSDSLTISVTKAPKATAPLIGDLLTLLASIIYGLYQVLYKKYVALPSDPDLLPDGFYEPIATFDGIPAEDTLMEEAIYPPPFGLHPNLLTSCIGLLTFSILWLPIPLLHYFDVEPFSFPSNATTILTIAGIAFSGLLFNAGFMVFRISVSLPTCPIHFWVRRFSWVSGAR